MDTIQPMAALEKGRLRLRQCAGAGDLARLLALRGLCFRGDAGADDRDALDAECDHVLIEETASGAVVGGFRLRLFQGAAVRRSYSAGFYDLGRLAAFPAPMLELGRFCLHPDRQDGDILRLAWGAITRQVDAAGVGLLFGCSSFAGCDPAPYDDAFALLRDGHAAPDAWRPGIAAPEVVSFAGLAPMCDRARALRSLPGLLRSYLTMGGWVSDHAVIDRALGTLHVFTGLEIGRVPPARARLLRGVAG
jgi:putative hemolysin